MIWFGCDIFQWYKLLVAIVDIFEICCDFWSLLWWYALWSMSLHPGRSGSYALLVLGVHFTARNHRYWNQHARFWVLNLRKSNLCCFLCLHKPLSFTKQCFAKLLPQKDHHEINIHIYIETYMYTFDVM